MILRSTRLAVLVSILLVTAGPMPPAAQGTTSSAARGAQPAHIHRANEVDASYRVHHARLQRFHNDLVAAVRERAPESYARLVEAPPAPVESGYGTRPTLVPGAPSDDARARATSTSYSWPRTEALLVRDAARLEALEQRLTATRRPPVPSADEWRTLVDDYLALDRDRRTIDEHIRHNRLWQDDVARRRAMYDANTSRYDLAIERDGVRDLLAGALGDRAAALAVRDAALTARLDAGAPQPTQPAYVRVERTAARAWVVHVPLVTDIDDAAYVEACRRAIEGAWRVQDGADRFEVRLQIRVVTPAALYAPALAPAPSSPLDVPAHVRRFPADAAALTTGGTSTHVWDRAIVLGPHDLSTTVLAHEFGHLLGLPDGYFRGYRDLGADGFEILEVVPDGSDIMSAPGAGRVQRRHFYHVLAR